MPYTEQAYTSLWNAECTATEIAQDLYQLRCQDLSGDELSNAIKRIHDKIIQLEAKFINAGIDLMV